MQKKKKLKNIVDLVMFNGLLNHWGHIVFGENPRFFNGGFWFPLIGGRGYIIPQLAVYTIYHLYITFWGVICYLPPVRGNQKQPLSFSIVALENPWYEKDIKIGPCDLNTSLKIVILILKRTHLLRNPFSKDLPPPPKKKQS